MKIMRFLTLIAAIVISAGLGLNSCRKNFERLMAIKTTSIDTSTFLIKGEIIDVGSGTPSYGFCYGPNPAPGLNDMVDSLGVTGSAKSFQTNIFVSPGSYYIRSYAKSSQGVVYGDDLKFIVRPGRMIEYYFDNGSDEYGWRMNPFNDGYLGNLFPVSSSGTIESVRIWFLPASDSGSEYVSVAFFNASGDRIGMGPVFVPKASEWITLSGLNIPFSGNFYAMVYWNYLIYPSNYLAEDQSGPNAYMDLAYYMSQKKWVRLSTSSAGNNKPGIFLIRVTVKLPPDKGGAITELGPAPGPVSPDNCFPSRFHPIPGDTAKPSAITLQSRSFPTK